MRVDAGAAATSTSSTPTARCKNLTQLAGYGVAAGFQGATAIAVREPAVHWNGTKAIFSMVIGAPTQQYQVGHLLLAALRGHRPRRRPTAGRSPRCRISRGRQQRQPGSTLPTADPLHLRPPARRRARTSIPSSTSTRRRRRSRVCGASIPRPVPCELLDHAPSGDFKPTVDSFGRVIFTRWDHLQRDQQADADALRHRAAIRDLRHLQLVERGAGARCRSATATRCSPSRAPCAPTCCCRTRRGTVQPLLPLDDEPGRQRARDAQPHRPPRARRATSTARSTTTEPRRVHLRRQRLRPLQRALADQSAADPREPHRAGRYYGIDAPEFYTHAAGQVLSLPGEPSRHPDDMPITEVTHASTASFTEPNEVPDPCHSGLYRKPLAALRRQPRRRARRREQPGASRDARRRQRRHAAAARDRATSFRLRGFVAAAGGCAGYQTLRPAR